MVQVNVAIMLAPVTFLGHITSQPIEAMARMQTDRVCHHILPAKLLMLLLLLLHSVAAVHGHVVMHKAVEQQSAPQGHIAAQLQET